MTKNSSQQDSRLLIFTEGQNRIITTSLTLFSGAALVCAGIFLFIVALKGLGYFSNIVGPVIVAFFLALLTRPWYGWIERKVHGYKSVAIILFVISFLIPLSVLGYFFGAFVYEQGTNLVQALPAAIHNTHAKLLELYPESKDLLDSIFPNIAAYFAGDGAVAWSKVGNVLQKGAHFSGTVFAMGSTTLMWLLTVFYWVIFVMQRPLTGEQFARNLPFLSAEGQKNVARYFSNFNDIIVSYFRGQIIDVTIQGLIYGVAFQLLGLPNGFIIGFILGVLNLMPYLGVIVGLSVALPIAFIHAGFSYTLVIFATFCCVQTFDGYIMQPYIQGNRMKLSAWQIVFALLFWTQLGGFLGLLLAIPLTAFVKASWDEWRESSANLLNGEGAHATGEDVK